MKYIKAAVELTEQIYELVQDTITTIYPFYYPDEVVEFFCSLHCKENICKDIKNGNVGVLFNENKLIGTGSREGNHITRVYVSPAFQGQGYGSFIMEKLEEEISFEYDTVLLDSSLPASHLYEKRGYKTIKHEKWKCKNDTMLVYEVMEKVISRTDTLINYNERFFVPEFNSLNGEVDEQTVFHYHQKGHILWAEYAGGDVLKGHLTGTAADDGTLDFYYQHINDKMQMRVGKCHSIPKILNNGKIELYEEWQWLSGDKSKGSSIITEK